MQYRLIYRHPEKFQDAHVMRAFGVFCIDGRFNEEFEGCRKVLGVEGMDMQRLAGGSLAFCAERYGLSPVTDFSIFSAQFAKKFHHIKEICVVDHADCGAYKSVLSQKHSKDRTSVTEDEIKSEQEANLLRAQKMLSERFPNLTIRIFRAVLSADNHVEVYELGA